MTDWSLIKDPVLRAAVMRAYESWRRWRDHETGQLKIPFGEATAE